MEIKRYITFRNKTPNAHDKVFLEIKKKYNGIQIFQHTIKLLIF